MANLPFEIPSTKELTPEEETLAIELYNRRSICLVCIQTVSEVDPSDPRRESAIAEYNRQLSVIDGRIKELTGKIPSVVIGLKPAILFPKAKGVSNGT